MVICRYELVRSSNVTSNTMYQEPVEQRTFMIIGHLTRLTSHFHPKFSASHSKYPEKHFIIIFNYQIPDQSNHCKISKITPETPEIPSPISSSTHHTAYYPLNSLPNKLQHSSGNLDTIVFILDPSHHIIIFLLGKHSRLFTGR
jgi:hypothetical protein